MTSGARRVIFGIKLSEDEAAACDTARGDLPRSEWGRALLLAAGVSDRPPRIIPLEPDYPVRKPRRTEPSGNGQCKHEHAIKGWCRECRTGGH